MAASTSIQAQTAAKRRAQARKGMVREEKGGEVVGGGCQGLDVKGVGVLGVVGVAGLMFLLLGCSDGTVGSY